MGETLGGRIRELRTERGWSLRTLAEKAKVNYSYLSKIENGKLEHTPSVRALVDVSKAFGVDDLELMRLAKRLPSVLDSIRSPEAVQFLRRASQTLETPDQWSAMLRHMEARYGKR